MVVLLANKYDIVVQVDWDTGLLDFQGDIGHGAWRTLIGELETLSVDWNRSKNETRI